MPEQCRKCGAQLFAGQQFCRACGTAVGQGTGGDDAPTRIFQPGAPADSPHATTARVRDQNTDPNLRPQTAAYQFSSMPQDAHVVSSTAPPRRRRSARWLWVTLGVALFGLLIITTVLSVVFFVTPAGRQVRMVNIKPPRPPIGTAPIAVPAMPDMKDGEMPFGAEGEEEVKVEGGKTQITRTYGLAETGASVSIKNISGKITVEGWDEPTAEVKITRSGGNSELERRAVKVRYSEDKEDTLALTTALPGEVEYRIKLPRQVRRLEIASQNSDVKLSGISGAIEVDVKHGDVELTGISGDVETKVIDGRTTVAFDQLGKDAESSFSSMNGDVELRFDGDVDADLRAETVNGNIEADGFELKAEKRIVGQQLSGRLGEGGRQLSVKVINGNIKLKK